MESSGQDIEKLGDAHVSQRPLSVTIIGCLFVAVGAFALAYHLTEFKGLRPFDYELAAVCAIRFAALLGGVFLLRGRNWARWLLVVWMAYHIILSAFHSLSELAMHVVIFGIVGWFLFQR